MIPPKNPDRIGELTIAPAPQFSLFYLLTLVTAFAIMFAVGSEGKMTAGSPNPSDPFWKFLFDGMPVLAGVVGLTGLVIVIREFFLNRRFLPHPGYLMLLIVGILVLLNIAVVRPTMAMLGEGQFADLEVARRQRAIFRDLQIVSLVVQFSVCCIGVFRYLWWWRVWFFLNCILVSFTTVALWLRSLSSAGLGVSVETVVIATRLSAWASVVVIVWLGAALVLDRSQVVRRDWVHWSGVFGWLIVQFGPPLLAWIALRFLPTGQIYRFF